VKVDVSAKYNSCNAVVSYIFYVFYVFVVVYPVLVGWVAQW